jgi:hypothetical protein
MLQHLNIETIVYITYQTLYSVNFKKLHKNNELAIFYAPKWIISEPKWCISNYHQ